MRQPEGPGWPELWSEVHSRRHAQENQAWRRVFLSWLSLTPAGSRGKPREEHAPGFDHPRASGSPANAHKRPVNLFWVYNALRNLSGPLGETPARTTKRQAYRLASHGTEVVRKCLCFEWFSPF